MRAILLDTTSESNSLKALHSINIAFTIYVNLNKKINRALIRNHEFILDDSGAIDFLQQIKNLDHEIQHEIRSKRRTKGKMHTIGHLHFDDLIIFNGNASLSIRRMHHVHLLRLQKLLTVRAKTKGEKSGKKKKSQNQRERIENRRDQGAEKEKMHDAIKKNRGWSGTH